MDLSGQRGEGGTTDVVAPFRGKMQQRSDSLLLVNIVDLNASLYF